MEKISFSLSPSLLRRIDDRVEDKYDNRSEALREIIRKGLDYDKDINRLENRIDELSKTAQQTSKLKNDAKEIVEQSKGFMGYLENKQRAKDQANIFKRLKWKIFGLDESMIVKKYSDQDDE